MRGLHRLTVLAWLFAVPAALAAQDDPVRAFRDAVDAYVTLHREVERHVPPPEISPRAGEIQRAVDAMAEAMRAARRGTDEGDIFTGGSGDVIRLRIRRALRTCGLDPADFAVAGQWRGEGTPLPVVNGRFAWELPSFMVPCVLWMLPELPEELEYRFVDRDLVLIDVHADLVADILRDAFPDPGSWRRDQTPRPLHPDGMVAD
ncbi:MAG: hypothetical protein FJW14_07400 [Acidimicrobiia bacterium]|nr:hypothetical protein [Acidimicrobiia bacterium]